MGSATSGSSSERLIFFLFVVFRIFVGVDFPPGISPPLSLQEHLARLVGSKNRRGGSQVGLHF